MEDALLKILAFLTALWLFPYLLSLPIYLFSETMGNLFRFLLTVYFLGALIVKEFIDMAKEIFAFFQMVFF
ncbi:MAG: hypothetical protein DRG25_01620 [Deltaproteobacteria bacterium]|nr:MAG: hypothetical protein DRG25_01620 [Deltaproteobacteria bacterium]